MEKEIVYNGVRYLKHPKQKYYYCSPTIAAKQYSRCLHRQMWFDAHGEIPKGYQLHHINGDAFDNRLENFELVERVAHITMHMKERVAKNPEWFSEFQKKGIKVAPEWHKSPEGIEWHRQHAIKCGFGDRTYGEANCDHCNKQYTKQNTFNRFCSNNCKSAWRRANKPDMKMVNCENCGVEFETAKYTPRRFCKASCRPTPNPLGHHARDKKVKINLEV